MHRDDLLWVDLRVSRLCQQFTLDYDGCSRLRQGLRDKVNWTLALNLRQTLSAITFTWRVAFALHS